MFSSHGSVIELDLSGEQGGGDDWDQKSSKHHGPHPIVLLALGEGKRNVFDSSTIWEEVR